MIVPLFLIVLIVAIPQLSETIYTPALPEIARVFYVSEVLTEYTLTTYLMGFGLGVLIWGTLSDKIGRKPGLLIGFFLYILACLGCYFSTNIQCLFVWRFIQAFGASVGSVLGQAVARDVTKSADRAHLFSSIAMALSLAPAIGPLMGSFSMMYGSWRSVFIMLIGIAIITMALIIKILPETRLYQPNQDSLWDRYKNCFVKMIHDKKVLGLGFLVGSVNGILFGYFAESPFFFIKMLGMKPTTFGTMSLFICIPLTLGGYISRILNGKKIESCYIILLGISLITLSGITFWILTYCMTSVTLSLLMIALVMTGVTIIIPNCLGPALEAYGSYAGTAASLFGFYYYLLISFMTGIMGWMHNGTPHQLPLFFLLQGCMMLIVFKKILLRSF